MLAWACRRKVVRQPQDRQVFLVDAMSPQEAAAALHGTHGNSEEFRCSPALRWLRRHDVEEDDG